MGLINIVKKVLENHSEYLSYLNDLRKSDAIDKLPVAKELLNNPIVDEYFKRNLKEDYKADASLEKRIAIAAAQLASEKFGYDREKSIEVAQKSAEFIRDARRTYKLANNEIKQKEYNTHKKVSFWGKVWGTAKSAWTVCNGKVKDWVKEKGFSYVLKKAAQWCPIPIVNVAARVWDIIPEPIKTVVKEGAKKVTDYVVDKIPVVAEKLYDAGKTVVKTSAKIIAKGAEIAISAGKAVGSVLFEGAKAVCSTVATCIEKAANVAKNVLSSLNPLNWF